MQAIKVYNRRGVDELVFFDVTATLGRAVRPTFAQIDELADECFMPLTVGGGVRNVEDMCGAAVRRCRQGGDQHRRRDRVPD